MGTKTKKAPCGKSEGKPQGDRKPRDQVNPNAKSRDKDYGLAGPWIGAPQLRAKPLSALPPLFGN
jgi:hypothetical protein